MQHAYIYKTFRRGFAMLLLIGVVSWSLGLPSYIGITHAANIEFISDLLSDSGPAVVSNHTITFTTPSIIPADGTIVLTFPTGFDVSDLTYVDFDIEDDGTPLDINGAAPSGTEWGVAAPAGQVITLTNGSVAIAADSVVEIEIGLHATTNDTALHQIINPANGSYVINVTSGSDSADTRVMILTHVSVTAAVDTIFTFTVTGIAQNQTINADAGTTTAYASTATLLPFGTLIPGEEYLLGQQLTVATNAKNGFSVTVQADQRLTSGSGATISRFDNDVPGASPIAWASPDNTIDLPLTFGHEGITTEDTTLTGAVDFFDAVAFYYGDFLDPLEVMYHTGPADGTTPDKGLTKVGYKIEIGAMQPAANDYTQTFRYVATPIF